MTLAVRSEIMEHFRSTIVTTAVLVAGLITAAQVLHPRDPALEMRGAKPVVATVEATTTWSDPPARTAHTAMTDAPLLRPASFTLLPVAMTASLSGSEEQAPGRPGRRVEHSRHRPALAGPRSRSAAVGTGVEHQASNPAASMAQPSRAAQGDPIGNLIKALGLGHDSEG